MLVPKVVELRLPTILLDGDAAAYVTVPSGANVKLYSDLLNGCRRRGVPAAALLYSSLRARRGRARAVVLATPYVAAWALRSYRIGVVPRLRGGNAHEYGSRVGL
jgi:hypothetical protein